MVGWITLSLAVQVTAAILTNCTEVKVKTVHRTVLGQQVERGLAEKSHSLDY
ncbi:hypothetical protein STRMA_0955 [Streptococcus macacae NCTC 11558]|uniref:Uncharacterized protein n=1 Tax=Streptococcus macacae NCTC 11558 TaxID=764298 RepID=G5JWI3_9STRE|nr:hypothetical protein STRMA_0955 [Streptococcus macacae NCTC 11558]